MSTSSGIEAIIGLAFFVLILPVTCAVSDYSCSSRAEKMGFKSTWGLVDGCMIKTKVGWLPIDSYRAVAE